jgi:hypothetical protein
VDGEAKMAGCGKCHDCGEELRTVLDGEDGAISAKPTAVIVPMAGAALPKALLAA